MQLAMDTGKAYQTRLEPPPLNYGWRMRKCHTLPNAFDREMQTMDRQRRSRYVLAVYLVVMSLAVILVLVGRFFTKSPDGKSVWINLGTGLLGVVGLFFMVQRFFLADEWGLSDRIEQLVRRLELSERPSARDFFVKAPVLDDYVRSAMQIDMCGVTLTSAVNKQFGNLRERLAPGASLRLLIADPDSLALEMSAQRSEVPEDVGYYLKRLEATLKDVAYLERGGFGSEEQDMQRINQNRGSFSVHLLPYAPSFGIYRFDTAAGKSDILVELYTHASGYANPPIFTLTPERDGVWYDYFAKQFEDMWQRAKPWTPGPDADEQLQSRQTGRRRTVRAADFLTSQSSLPLQRLSSASTIYLSGFTLGRKTREYLRFLDERLRTGAAVRIMILDPKQELLEECVVRSSGISSVDHWRKRLDSTASLVEVIASSPDITGSLELGYLPYLPAYGFSMVDPDTPDGIIVVELYHHRSTEDNPTFELRATRDGEWYNFFRRQFDLMWASCRVEKLSENR